MSPFALATQSELSVGTTLSRSSTLAFYKCLFLCFGRGSHGGEALEPLGTMVPQEDSSRAGAHHGMGPATLLLLTLLIVGVFSLVFGNEPLVLNFCLGILGESNHCNGFVVL